MIWMRLTSRRYLYAAFEAQQAAEKGLKAIIQENSRIPPKLHNLVELALEAGLEAEDLVGRLAALSAYYIATRYPEVRKALSRQTTEAVAQDLLNTAEEVLSWAKRRLTSSES